MGTETHWESVYGTKSPEAVSWYAPHLLQSLHYVRRAARSKQASIIDVGGGESTLVDDLLADGYQDITVLDLSRTALEVTQLRLGPRAARWRGLRPISWRWGCLRRPWMCGTTARCSTFSPAMRSVSAMWRR